MHVKHEHVEHNENTLRLVAHKAGCDMLSKHAHNMLCDFCRTRGYLASVELGRPRVAVFSLKIFQGVTKIVVVHSCCGTPTVEMMLYICECLHCASCTSQPVSMESLRS